MLSHQKFKSYSYAFWGYLWAFSFDISFVNGAKNVVQNFNGNLDHIQNMSAFNYYRYNEYQPFVFNRQNYYLAAVIEYSAIVSIDYEAGAKENLQQYLSIIKECGKSMIDIVVFPECGLYNCNVKSRDIALEAAMYVPSPEEHIIPCQDTRAGQAILHDLSCAAKENNIYVASVLMEKFCVNGTSCSMDELLLYNSVAVFDRKGMVIARYRKFNLYTEQFTYGVNQTSTPEMVTFTTDFGVKFGLMICFDELLPLPSIALVKEYNVMHMIHSSAMLSRLPFLAVASVDAGWSYSMDVIMLTASLPSPLGSLGSNIYFGRRQFTNSYVKNHGSSKIIVAPVPKNYLIPLQMYPLTFANMRRYSPNDPGESHFLVEHTINEMATKSIFIQKNEPIATFQYRSSSYECTINVTFTENTLFPNWPNYKFLAYSGLTNYSVATLNNYAEMCGLVLCATSFDNLCHLPPRFHDSSEILFTSVNISAVSFAPDELRIPATLVSNLMALNNAYFNFDSFNDNLNGRPVNVVHMRLTRPTSNLVTFGIYKAIEATHPIANFDTYDYDTNLDIVWE